MEPLNKVLSPKQEKQALNISQKEQSALDPHILWCVKHNSSNVQFICTVEGCKENRCICDVCKKKESIHISYHSHYIYKLKEFYQFSSHHGKNVLSRLDKGVSDLEQHVSKHKQFYQDQLRQLNEDFDLIVKTFGEKINEYKKVYVDNFQKEIQAFDGDLVSIINTLKSYANEKSSQDSFFTKLFSSNSTKGSKLAEVEDIVSKNQKGFEVRASILTLKSKLAASKGNKTEYKPTQKQKNVFEDLLGTLDSFCSQFFHNMQHLLVTTSQDSPSKISNPPDEGQEKINLKSSIFLQMKQMNYSGCQGELDIESNCNPHPNQSLKSLRQSNVSIALSEGNLEQLPKKLIKVEKMPDPHPKVREILQYLKPLPMPLHSSNSNEQGPYRYETGVYKGFFSQDRVRQGRGVFIFDDGSYYQGSWENDNMSGYGRLVKPNSYYEGDIKEGFAHGKGNFEDHEKTYTGEWRHDLRHGYGEEQFKCIDKHYIGTFVNDKYEGKGKLTHQDAIYQGQFRRGLFQGEGTVRYKNGQLFKGSFKENQKVFGRHSFPDGSYYQGSFYENMPNGKGNFYWPDGIKYSGQWRDGLQDGLGIETLVNGKSLKGVWQRGVWLRWL